MSLEADTDELQKRVDALFELSGMLQYLPLADITVTQDENGLYAILLMFEDEDAYDYIRGNLLGDADLRKYVDKLILHIEPDDERMELHIYDLLTWEDSHRFT